MLALITTLPVFCTVLPLIACSNVSAKIQIGALTQENDEILKTFLHGISKENEKHFPEQLMVESTQLDMSDSFAVISAICQNMASGTFAFFTAQTMATIETIKACSATFRLPFVTLNIAMNTSGQELANVIYVRPYYTKAIVDVVKNYKWEELLYFYNSDEGLERWQQLQESFIHQGHFVRTFLYRVQNADDAINTIQRLDRRTYDKHILLDLPTNDCEEIFRRQAKTATGMSHSYFVVTLGITDIDPSLFYHGGLNVAGFRMIDTSGFRNFLKQLNLELFKGARKEITHEIGLAADAASVISLALRRMLEDNPNVFQKDLLNGSTPTPQIDCYDEHVQQFYHGHEIARIMKMVDFRGLTGHVKFDRFGLRRDYQLDIINSSGSDGLAKIGTWHPERGLTILAPIKPLVKPKQPFNQRTRIVTSILVSPYLMLKSGKDLTGNDKYEGYCADLIKEIAAIAGFEYVISSVKDGKYGIMEANHSWNGMIGELIRHEADLAVAPLTITSAREVVVDFSQPFLTTGISIMMKKPAKGVPSVFSFLNTFSFEIWMCIIFAYLGNSVVSLIVKLLSEWERNSEDQENGLSWRENILDSFFLCLGPRGNRIKLRSRSISGRIVVAVWWIFVLFMVSFYTAKLMSMESNERRDTPIESAEDLERQTKIKYGTVASGTTREFFMTSTNPIYERMNSFMERTSPSVFVKSIEEGVDVVRKGNYAFLLESVANEYISGRLPCDTMRVGSNLNSRGYGIATPLGSELRRYINLALLELREAGVLLDLHHKWFKTNDCESSYVRTLPKSYNVIGVFYILIGAACLAFIVLACEYISKSIIEFKRKKNAGVPTVPLEDLGVSAPAEIEEQATPRD